MNAAQVLQVVALLALVAVLFVLALAEASLLRVRTSKVAVAAQAGDRRAQKLLDLLDDLPRVMNAVLLAVLLAQVSAATIAGALAHSWFGGSGITIATIAVTLVLFVYGEAIPKTMAVRNPFTVARQLARPISWLDLVLRPFVTVLVRFADAQVPGPGISTVSVVSEEELVILADEAASAGQIDETDAELIERSFAFGDTNVSEIIVPLADVVAVSTEARAGEALQLAIAAGHRRLPVYDGAVDNFVGFVRLRDLVQATTNDPETVVGDRYREALTVRDSERATSALRSMQQSRAHLAVVVNDRGDPEGIITVEDVVEELVGTIEDPEI